MIWKWWIRMILRHGWGDFQLGLVKFAGQIWLRMAIVVFKGRFFFPMATYRSIQLKLRQGREVSRNIIIAADQIQYAWASIAETQRIIALFHEHSMIEKELGLEDENEHKPHMKIAWPTRQPEKIKGLSIPRRFPLKNFCSCE